jgi:hypothetical protein
VSSYPFTGPQATIVTSDPVSGILGQEAATRVAARFEGVQPDAEGNLDVDLGDDRLGIINALREISTDTEQSADRQAPESLLKGLAGTG